MVPGKTSKICNICPVSLHLLPKEKKAFRPAKKELFIISLLFFPSPLCGMLDTAGGKEKTSPDCSNDFLVGAGGGGVVCKRNSDLSRCEVCAADGQFHVGGRARAIWMMRNRLCNCVSTAPNTNKFAPLRHFHGSFDVPQKKKFNFFYWPLAARNCLFFILFCPSLFLLLRKMMMIIWREI